MEAEHIQNVPLTVFLFVPSVLICTVLHYHSDFLSFFLVLPS